MYQQQSRLVQMEPYITGILRNGMRCIIAWNVALEEQGKPNIGPFPCGGLVTLHSGTHEVTRSGQYWGFAQFSRHIQRNAVVIDSHGEASGINHVAVANPDSSYALVLTHAANSAQDIEVRFGKLATRVTLAPDSIVTLSWRAA